MPQVFVSTSAPEGWELGTWREVSPPGTWEEIKGDGTSYKFKSLQMACTPKERRVHLQMSGTSTEVMLLETSAQIFVDGCFFGAYVGRWENVVLDTDAVETVTEVDAANAINAEAPPPMPAKGYEIEAEQPLKASAPAECRTEPPAEAVEAAAPNNSEAAPGRRKADLDKSAESAALLLAASTAGSVEEVRRLLDTVDPDAMCGDGWTALLVASRQGNKDIVQALLDAGANPNIMKDGNSAMQLAFKAGHQEIFKLLFTVAFQTLDSVVGPQGSPAASTAAARVQDNEVPESAYQDLKNLTKHLADIGKINKADKSELVATTDDGVALPPEADSDKDRGDALKDALKRIARVTA
eukprot:TRINITY_DN62641_c0_g1_i1.p1 TRINITY_DN62641_c0_g1~~TRINITY_DN62641_c0_g1_i1.p1  ORF type:complete len:378 (+),score=107.86 TRINITY_DN62641_c0_g1_i1:74-1135(+)